MSDRLKESITGALYGVAVGDALGAPLEFMSAEQIREKHGFVTEMLGGGWLSVVPGEVTDDTQMTLAVAEGIIEAPDAPVPAVGKRFIHWLESSPKDVGATCGASIRWAAILGRYAARPTGKGLKPEIWAEAAQRVVMGNGGRSGGNGALMRTVYPGLYYRDRLEAAERAQDIARMTHWDEKASEACVLFTVMLNLITEAAIAGTQEELKDKLTVAVWQYGYGQREECLELTPTGYVVDSMRCVLWALRTSGSFEEAVAKAANLGGDADTIAAITGGLAGAYYGFSGIPVRWVDALDEQVKVRLTSAAVAAQIARAE